MVAYATAPGRTASDVGTGGGTYAKALADEIVKPGVDSVLVFTRVARRVQREIGQDPFLSASTMPEIYFAGEGAAFKPMPTGQLDRSELERAAAFIRETEDQARLEAFIRQFGDSPYADMARARLDELKKRRIGMAVPPKGAPPVSGPTIQCEGTETLVGSQRRCLRPRDSFKDCDTCPEMVVMPAGDFIMGSANEHWNAKDEGPLRKVTIDSPFAASKFETTFAEWDGCVTAGGCKQKPTDQGWGRGRHPVINVSWDDITVEFLPWLSRKTGKTYRLLTEAEWEYAARSGTTSKFFTGATITTEQANFDGRDANGQYRQRTVEAGSFQPNAFGLHDMHGNVLEWVQDCYRSNYAGASSDSRAATEILGCQRVLRGGSWGNYWTNLRSAHRMTYGPRNRDAYTGFRVARTLN